MIIHFIKIKLVHLLNNILGNYSYQKFVIITRSRTGSNYLVSLINSHNDIDVYKTIFRTLEKKTTKQIWSQTFAKKRKVNAVGFKLFYYHPEDSSDKSIWNYLIEDKSIKIIHLTRDNILRTHISRLIAGKNQLWVNDSGKDVNLADRKVKVNIDEFLQDVEVTTKYQYEVEEKFSNHDLIHIRYEDLIQNKSTKMSEIFAFLSVKPLKTTSDLTKQNSESISEIVSNFDELSQKLKYSELEWMLNN